MLDRVNAEERSVVLNQMTDRNGIPLTSQDKT
jgi:hypothetical protein